MKFGDIEVPDEMTIKELCEYLEKRGELNKLKYFFDRSGKKDEM